MRLGSWQQTRSEATVQWTDLDGWFPSAAAAPYWVGRAKGSSSRSRPPTARLKAIVVNRSSVQRHVWRAKMIHAAFEGLGTSAIMWQARVAKPCMWRWHARHAHALDRRAMAEAIGIGLSMAQGNWKAHACSGTGTRSSSFSSTRSRRRCHPHVGRLVQPPPLARADRRDTSAEVEERYYAELEETALAAYHPSPRRSWAPAAATRCSRPPIRWAMT
jgi:hypothetical protein